MKRQWKSNPVFRKFREKSLFWGTFAMLSILSIVSLLIFSIVVNQLMVKNQRMRIHELSLSELRQTSDNIDTRLISISENMEQDLWSKDLVSLMVNPMGRNSESNFLAVNSLQSYVDNSRLILKAWLYVPALKEIYSSTGNYIALESSAEKNTTLHYLNIVANRKDNLKDNEMSIYRYGNRIIEVVDFYVPDFIGALFFEIDPVALLESVENSSNSKIQVYTVDGRSLTDVRSPETMDFSDTEKFMTEGNTDSNAEWYLQISDLTGWYFVQSVSDSQVSTDWNSFMGVFLGFVILYFVISQIYSLYISRYIYRPINRLLHIAESGYGKPGAAYGNEAIQSEIDYLELVYTDTLDQNQQHRQLMASISNDIMEQLFRSILSGKALPEGYVANTLEGTGHRELEEGRYVALAGSLIVSRDTEPTLVEAELYQRSLLNVVNQINCEIGYRYAFYMEKEMLTVILCFDLDTSVIQVKQCLKDFGDQLLNQTRGLPFEVFLGKGKIYNDILSLRYSFQEAMADVRYQQYMKDEDSEAINSGNFDRKYYEERVLQVVEMAEKGNREDAEHMANVLIEELAACEPDRQTDCCEAVLDAMIEKMIAGRINSEDLKELGLAQSSEELKKSIQQGDLKTFLTTFCSKAIGALQSGSKKRRYKYVDEARDYIASHYSDGDLSLNSVSEAIGISAPYLSGVFNEVMKENFNSYLNSYRVSRAMEFLEKTSQNVAEIGYKCGFNSAQSFSRVFKKYTGFTPGQYRDNRKGGQR